MPDFGLIYLAVSNGKRLKSVSRVHRRHPQARDLEGISTETGGHAACHDAALANSSGSASATVTRLEDLRRMTCLAKIDAATSGKPEIFRLQREAALSSKLQQPPLLSRRNSLHTPHADGALADAKSRRKRPLRAKDFLDAVDGFHEVTSHTVKLAVKAPREETPTSCRVKMRQDPHSDLTPNAMPRNWSTSRPERTPMQIAVRLEACRIAFGLTQTEFCRRAGIGLNTYGNYKSRKRKSRPLLDEMLGLCDAFPNITLD